MFIVVQTVWVQTSADFNAMERKRTLCVTQDTTVKEIMEWAERANVLAAGDVVITAPDTKG